MDSLQAARELRHALQTFITSNTDIMADESRMMEFATLYPTWEELLATKKTYPAKTIFRWGVNAAGEPQLEDSGPTTKEVLDTLLGVTQ